MRENSFPLLTIACKGRINPESLTPLLDVQQFLEPELRAELREFMCELGELLGPVKASQGEDVKKGGA
jgi:hypothetical protein